PRTSAPPWASTSTPCTRACAPRAPSSNARWPSTTKGRAMSDLSPKARAIVDAGRVGDGLAPGHRANLRAGLAARLGHAPQPPLPTLPMRPLLPTAAKLLATV